MENVFGPLNTLEVQLEKKLEFIARQIDSILKNINETEETTMLAEELEKIENDVGDILKDMEKRMKEGFKREKKGSDTLKEDKSTSSKAGLDKEHRRSESDSFFIKCGAMARLRDMINDLDLQVKHCFFCLAVFPEDSIIKKRLLIYLWIGWGIVVPVGNNTAEQVAERCFTELVNKGLVNPIYRKHRKIVDSFSMNSRIREVMISEAEKRRFFLSEKKTKEILDELIISEPDKLIKGSLQVVRYSRDKDSLALVNVNVQEQYLQFKANVEAAKKETNNKMENFRVMQLGRWQSVDKPHIEMESIEFLERFLKELSVEWKRLQDMFSSLGCLEVKECPILLKEKFEGALDSEGLWRKEY
ncbi:hypothetical protein J5N97_011470 [Dioscorea zingiberensis]|uniref:Disease resistance protein winged helix domain-containing protein n=1 Tax=Dioscorea zingiberensis TaxID=325984 RepID=A0A9D5D354_9LILI|nr:hypothetical protein J5N97_011470 [Dioscorea zingiberensis]